MSESSSTAVTVGERPATMALIRPVATPMALMELHKEIATVIGSILQEGIDYGKIPGAGDKAALFKAGAERVCFAFGCAVKYEVVQREIEHDRSVPWTKRKKLWRNQFKGDREFTWQEEAGASLGLYRYEIRCQLVRREDGAIVAEGLGSCSTMESKYIDRPRDCENTVLKMAQKRAMVAAVLNGFGLSDRFTQDVEDLPHAEVAPSQPAPASAAPSEAQQAAAVDELEGLLPGMSVDQQIYVKEKLRDGADPVALLALVRQKGGASTDGNAPSEKQLAFYNNLVASSVFTEEEKSKFLDFLETATRQTIKGEIDRLKKMVDVRKAAPAGVAAAAERIDYIPTEPHGGFDGEDLPF